MISEFQYLVEQMKFYSLFDMIWCMLLQIKQYPGYNFISLIFGPASDTQKRLERVSISYNDIYLLMHRGFDLSFNQPGVC